MEYYNYIKLNVSNFRNTLFYNLKQFVNKFKVAFIKTIEVNNIFIDDSEESQEDNEYNEVNEEDQVDNEEDNQDNEDHVDNEEDKEGVPFSKRKRGELFISIYDSDIENSDEDQQDQQDIDT